MTRIVRHWKQQFDPNARFIFIRPMQLEGRVAQAGEEVPEGLLSPLKLKVWWRAHMIALRDWDYEKGCPKDPDYSVIGYGWYQLTDGRKVHGKKKLEEALAALA